MVKKCIYCNAGVEQNSVVDMCKPCMYQVWGEKMSHTIIANMEREKDSGNLELGNVSQTQPTHQEPDPEHQVAPKSTYSQSGTPGFE
ncbi:MAG: hypothetical protein ACI83O_000045 [Patescibacteria group bacterium]|jgi:hypothetical protein